MVSCGVMLYFRPLLSSLVVMGERDCEERLTICDPFWENPYKRGHQLFFFFFTYRIYGARGPRLPSLTEITQVPYSG